jgi:hypothetical protein
MGYVEMAKEDLEFMIAHPEKFTRKDVNDQRQLLRETEYDAKPREDEVRAANTIVRRVKKYLRRGHGRTRRHRRHRMTRRR